MISYKHSSFDYDKVIRSTVNDKKNFMLKTNVKTLFEL